MTKMAPRWIVVGLLILISGTVFAQNEVKIGILAYRPKQMVQAQWAPLATALNQSISGYGFVIEIYDFDEMSAAVDSRQVDFVLTNPSSYLLMAKRSGLSSPLATLSNLGQGKPINAFGGVIFTRSGRTDINRLEDVRGKSVAFTSTESFGGFQVQAYELGRAGIKIPKDVKVVVTGQPHDNVVDAVLAQRADVGFIRSGLLEEFARKGKLNLSQVTVINPQILPGFPAQVSTRLYPEWPFSALPQTSNDLKRKVSAFLLTLHENNELANQLQIHGFDVPSNYAPVEYMLREMHLPPYDAAPIFTATDVWNRYRWLIVSALTSTTIILLLGFYILLVNRWLNDRSRALYAANMQLQHEVVERKRAESKLRELSAHLQTVREEEKTGVARDVHDNLGSIFTALKIDIYWLKSELSANAKNVLQLERIESMSKLLDSAVDVTRRVITDLRPSILDDLGLCAALEWQAGQFSKRTGVKCVVTCLEHEGNQTQLNKVQSINLFRICQEALSNIVKHSGASRVEIELHYGEDEVVLDISDNGCGLPQGHVIAPTSYGMLGMRERVEQLNGRIDFYNLTRCGFGVTVILPLFVSNQIESSTH